MLQEKEIATVDVQSEVELVHRPFRVEENSKLLTLLVKNLYSDPIKAVVREIFANARDACRERERLEGLPANSLITYIRPPSEDYQFFAIKDEGIGINRQRYEEVYCSLGASTKEKTQDQVGGWGIGGKCPTAYTQSFLIETTYKHEGRWERSVINVYLGGTDLVYRGPAHIEEPGTVVKIPVASSDIDRFNEAIREYTNAIKKPIFKIVGEGERPRPSIVKTMYPRGFRHPVEVGVYSNDRGKPSIVLAIDEVPYHACWFGYSYAENLIGNLTGNQSWYVYINSEDIGVGVARENVVKSEEKFENLREALDKWREELISIKLKEIANEEDQDEYYLCNKINDFVRKVVAYPNVSTNVRDVIEAAKKGIPKSHKMLLTNRDAPPEIARIFSVSGKIYLAQALLKHTSNLIVTQKKIRERREYQELERAIGMAYAANRWVIFEGEYLNIDKDTIWTEVEIENYCNRVFQRFIKYGGLEKPLAHMSAELLREQKAEEGKANMASKATSKEKKERVSRPTIKEDLWRKAWGEEPKLVSTKDRRVLVTVGQLGELCPKQRECLGDGLYSILELKYLVPNAISVSKRYADDITAWLERKGWDLDWIKVCALPEKIVALQKKLGARTLFYGLANVTGVYDTNPLYEILRGGGDPLTEDMLEGMSVLYSTSDFETIKATYEHNVLMREFLDTWPFSYNETVSTGYVYQTGHNTDKIKTTEDLKAALREVLRIHRLQEALRDKWGFCF